MTLTDRGDLRALLSSHGFRFSKGLGQHFLVNPAVCPKMADACALTKDDGALEIGPGIGVLTRELCQRAGKVVAIELDKRLPEVLAQTMDGYDNFRLIEGDAMTLDLSRLIHTEFAGREVCLCANLPYYLTSPLILRLLENRLPLRCITVMVQKEAAVRLCARQGTRESGAVTLAVQYYAKAERLFDVPRGSFEPPPKVDSSVIRLTPLFPSETLVEKTMFRLIRAAFSQRRKTVLNSLSSAGIAKDRVALLCERCGIPPSARAEQLTLSHFTALARALDSEDREDG